MAVVGSSPRYQRSHSLRHQIIQRSFDILCASFLLTFVWPIILLVGIGIRIQSPGPLLFFQVREGLGDRRFRICKLRTMHTDADEHAIVASERAWGRP